MIQKTIQLGTNPTCTLHCMLQEKGSKPRPAAIVCPGGAYAFYSETESESVAAAFFSHGFHAFVLRYSLNLRAIWPQTAAEAGLAVMTLRQNAEEWGLDPNSIAIGGFSAGGSVAANIGTYWNDPEVQAATGAYSGENRPNALFLFYPAADLHMPQLVDGALSEKHVDPASRVREDTPPAFIGHTYEDNVVSMMQSIKLAQAYSAAFVPMELHIYTPGEHGALSRTENAPGRGGERTPDLNTWIDRCCEWLGDQFYRSAPPLTEEEARTPFGSMRRVHNTEPLADLLTSPNRFGPQETEAVDEQTSLSRVAKVPEAWALLTRALPKLASLQVNELAGRQSLGKWFYYAGLENGDPARQELLAQLAEILC